MCKRLKCTSQNAAPRRMGFFGIAADSYYLRGFYCEYRKINCRCNRARSLRLSKPPWISLIWQPWNQIYSLLRASYTIYRRESTGSGYRQKGWGDTYSWYRYSDTFPIPMNRGRNQWRRYEIIHVAIVKAWKARDKCRRRIIDTITFTYRYKLYPMYVRTSFTTHCYPI